VVDRLFEGEEAVLHLIERIVAPLGNRVDGSSPWVDARLPDGSRVQTNSLALQIATTAGSAWRSGRVDPWRLPAADRRDAANIDGWFELGLRALGQATALA
jgi:type IV secretory pathway ATPase VirB11/archaellum biosynthesis ATPase